MGKQYKQLTPQDIAFIQAQKLFYLASSSGGEVNLSPKGYDSIRVLDAQTLVFLNYPGSGNRTHRDTVQNGEFTLVFNAFEGAPKILRLFCKSSIIERESERFHENVALFGAKAEVVRDLFEFRIYAVESSCGMSVPYMQFQGERDELRDWAYDMDAKGKLEEYKAKRFNPPDLSKI